LTLASLNTACHKFFHHACTHAFVKIHYASQSSIESSSWYG
jgi:hypothetical protein